MTEWYGASSSGTYWDTDSFYPVNRGIRWNTAVAEETRKVVARAAAEFDLNDV